jgi:hypothetical protein
VVSDYITAKKTVNVPENKNIRIAGGKRRDGLVRVGLWAVWMFLSAVRS